MRTLIDTRPQQTIAPIGGALTKQWIAGLLIPVSFSIAFAGLFSAGVLSLGHVLHLPVPCGASRGCVAVAMHPASKLFGVPIAFFGVAADIALVLLLTRIDVRRARIALVTLAGLGTAASGYLLYYSQTVIQATCPWCVASGAAMAILLVLSSLLLWHGPALRPVRPGFVLGLALVTAAGVGVQAGLMERAASLPPIPAERLQGFSAGQLVDPGKALGPEDAAVTIVVFADMWCPGCRAVHAALTDYQHANPQKVQLAYRHLPLVQIRGHQFSGTAAALSEIAAENGEFWTFLERIYRDHRPLTGSGYEQLLGILGIDTEEVRSRLSNLEDPACERVLRDMELADELGVTATPTFIVLVDGHPPVSANQRTLPRILNSPAITTRLGP